MTEEKRKGKRALHIAIAVLTALLLALLVMAAVEKLYATGQTCIPTGDCTVANGSETIGPEDSITGQASGRWAQRNIVWNFSMNDSQSEGTFNNANITIYNMEFTWTASGGSDQITLQYCISGTCFGLANFTQANASDPVQNVTYQASNIATYTDVNNTEVRFIGTNQLQGPDDMTVILDAVSIDVEFTPPTISASSSINSTTIFEFESTTATGNCTCTGGTCDSVSMKLQDNRTGSFTDSTTNTNADIYTNTTNYSIGTLTAGSTATRTFNVTANTAGTYGIRAQCNSTNTVQTTVNSTSDTLTVNPNTYNTTIISPNSTNTTGINAGDNITIRFNFTKNDNQITTDLNVTNITVGGATCTELPGLAFSSGLWEVNCTTDSGLTDGLKDLFLEANYTPDPGVANDTNPQSVNVTALAPPNVTSVVVDEAPPLGEITLLAGRTVPVLCNATVTDVNGGDEIAGANATFFFDQNQSTDPDDNNSHYTNSSCSSTGTGTNSKNFTCSFDVFYYAVNGTWNCNVTAFDDASFNDSKVNTTTINPLFALNTSTSLINYGNASINTTSREESVNVTNIGNQPINVSVWGYGGSDPVAGDGLAMVCPDNNISIENERFSDTSVTYNSKTPLNSSPKQMNFTIPKQTQPSVFQENDTFWQMFVPQTDPPLGKGTCNGTVIFQAEQS